MKQRGGSEFTDPNIAEQMIDEIYDDEQMLMNAADFSRELLNRVEELDAQVDDLSRELENEKSKTNDAVIEQAAQINSEMIEHLTRELEDAKRERDSYMGKFNGLMEMVNEEDTSVEEYQSRIRELEAQQALLQENIEIKETELEHERGKLDEEREILQAKMREIQDREQSTGGTSDMGSTDEDKDVRKVLSPHLKETEYSLKTSEAVKTVIDRKQGKIDLLAEDVAAAKLKAEKEEKARLAAERDRDSVGKKVAAIKSRNMDAEVKEAMAAANRERDKAVKEKDEAVRGKEDCDKLLEMQRLENTRLLSEIQEGALVADAEREQMLREERGESLLDELGGAAAFSEHELERLRKEVEDIKSESSARAGKAYRTGRKEMEEALRLAQHSADHYENLRFEQEKKAVEAEQKAAAARMATARAGVELERQRRLTEQKALRAPKDFTYTDSISHGFPRDSPQDSGTLSLVRDGPLKGVRITPRRKKDQTKGFDYTYDEIDSITIDSVKREIKLVSNTAKGKGFHSKWTLSGFTDFNELKTDLTTYFGEKVSLM